MYAQLQHDVFGECRISHFFFLLHPHIYMCVLYNILNYTDKYLRIFNIILEINKGHIVNLLGAKNMKASSNIEF